MKRFTHLFLSTLLLVVVNSLTAQTTITQWNFNSNPADASTSTGSTIPSIGAGTLATIGGVAATFSSGSNSGGSSDPALTDNTGLGLSNSWPAQGTNNKTAGIQFAVSTVGHTGIMINFDLRHSNTGPKHFTVQYTTDVNATTPVWVDFVEDSATIGDVFVNNRSYNLSSITALNNNANAGFRIVSSFRPSTSIYAPATTASLYSTTGTWRFDMVTVKGTVSATSGTVSFIGSKTSVLETTTTVRIIAKILGAGVLPSSVDIEILPISTATNSTDFTIAAPLKFEWAANANDVNDTILVTINNDALQENAEYFIVQFTNPVNTILPSAATNHFTVMITDNDKVAPIASQSITLNHIASFSNGASASNSAEIVAHDPVSQRLFIANSVAGKIDIVNFKNPSAATLITSILVTPTYGNINSIAVRNGIVAAAIENLVPEQPGKIVFFDTTGAFISQVTAGAMPDMITFSNDGTKVLTANEGQPNAAYTIDPEGSITIVNIAGGVASVTQANVTTASFASFNIQAVALRASGVRLFGLNNPTVAQDMEPEYISFSADGGTAYVTCQENNAIAVVNIATSTITAIRPLGTKNHSLSNNAFDLSDQGGIIEIANWPVKGLYMPDAIATYTVAGQTYYITANEGDAREYGSYNEATRASSSTYILDSATFLFRHAIKANIGRLNVTNASGDTDGDGDFDEIHTFGARSISIWNATTGTLVWDSGDTMELITAKHPIYGAIFNASNANNNFKNRSDDKGPEPEGVTIAEIGGKMYAFVALERIGGCMVFDVTNPANPIYVDYKNTRNLAAFGGDNGAEGILFISAANSPTGNNIVILANEISSTLSFFSINVSTLDINLTNITAKNEGSKNRINWNTAGEDKDDIFELERSKDGILFSKIATINAHGFASGYSYVDENPVNGRNYYRLKMKNVSGYNSISATVSVNTGTKAITVQVSPNPFKDQLIVKNNNTSIVNGVAEIFDAKGALQKSIKINRATNCINVASLPAGTYILKYTQNKDVQSFIITKQ